PRALRRKRNRIKGIASLAEYRGNLRSPLLQALEVILAMIENDAGKGLINAIVDVITLFAVAYGLANDPGNRSGGGGDEKAPRLGQNLDVFREEAVDFGIDLPGEQAERLDMFVVGRGKSAPDIEDFDFMPARLGLLHHGRGQVERLDKILEIGALASHMKAQALDDEAHPERCDNKVHRFSG